ncbi:hypothetical protein KAFR_0F02300 [Kazachstania africana CBS 2517]|uniref:GOLD domain-containing protein n=1 Tax=Kazachstania africana (strain ATCC 22294 / BCRC 22015 / CBS 2517 / CECT 1963 / NBRC 1671 / NRRL Y-8276) TaxID=1071382 RepID=H2AWS7_KAZAF|nr:hypothetical protein KAFR_0F02300 [Kazachstania africana CBS 2517]CCF58827.1 hypothetical protein KAFR_0F02300 [Kazachstania africana CBS 2517]
MRGSLTATVSVFLLVVNVVCASPVTFELKKGITDCFNILTPTTDCQVIYYFAVQFGENEDYKLSYDIYEPGSTGQGNPIISRVDERQGEWTFVGKHKGEYKFCFNGGSKSDKVVDLEIQYDCDAVNDVRADKRARRKANRNLKKTDEDELSTSLENSIDSIERQLFELENNLRYYTTRNLRNHQTVSSTNRRIVLFSIYGILLVLGMSIGQILVLQWFFKESRKRKV